MKELAIVEEDICINRVVVPDDWSGAKGEWQPPARHVVVDDPTPQIGWRREGESWSPPESPTLPASMPVADWIELWPRAKRVAAYRAAQTDDTMADGLMLLQAQQTIKLRGHARTEGFIAYAVSAGYLTQTEADNLLDGLPADTERR